MSIRIIAMDLDGTLLDSNKTISAHTTEVLRRAHEMGYYVVPSTGRSFVALPPELNCFPCSYLLINSGGTVIDCSTGKHIYRAEISKDTLIRYHEIISRYNVACNYITDNASHMSRPHQQAFFSAVNTAKDGFWADFFCNRQTLFDDFNRWLDEVKPSVLKINLFFKNAADLPAVRSELETLPELAICLSPSNNLEITHRDATKGKALLALAKHLNLSSDQIIAFGDTDNDISMLKAVGIGVAMGNAIPETKAVADRVTKSNDEDGVAWGIEQWIFTQPLEV